MLALIKRNFLLYFRNRSGVILSLFGAIIPFVLYIVWWRVGSYSINNHIGSFLTAGRRPGADGNRRSFYHGLRTVGLAA